MSVLWNAEEAALATKGRTATHWEATGVAIDSRSVQRGDLFVALKGENTDGHHFVTAALQNGASAAIVSDIPKDTGTAAPLLVVENTLQALKNLAAFGRKRSKAQVIGVTGSVGKTSTKEALRFVLEKQGKVHASSGNFNNHIGVPLSLARMPQDTKFAIFEMGMNHKGEIAELTTQVRPAISIITTVEPAHLQFFDSVEAIADAKAEIFLGMGRNSMVILNRDNPHYQRLAQAAKAAGISVIVGFGEDLQADFRMVRYTQEKEGCEIEADLGGQMVTYSLGAQGKHQAKNTLAVLAAVQAAGGNMMQAAEALAEFEAPAGRGQRLVIEKGNKRFTLIDDSYNASPASIKAALRVLGAQHPLGRKIALLGDMRELGAGQEIELHKGLLRDIEAYHIDGVITVGPLMQHLYDILPAEKRLAHYPDVPSLLPNILQIIASGDEVLVKGSHGIQMYNIVEFFKEKDAQEAYAV